MDRLIQILTIIFRRNHLQKYNLVLFCVGISLIIGPSILVNFTYNHKTTNTSILLSISNLTSSLSSKINLPLLGLILVGVSLINFYLFMLNKPKKEVNIYLDNKIINILNSSLPSLNNILNWSEGKLIHIDDLHRSITDLDSIRNNLLEFKNKNISNIIDKLDILIKRLAIDFSVRSNHDIDTKTIDLLKEVILLVKNFGNKGNNI